jgi:hypothetical protein
MVRVGRLERRPVLSTLPNAGAHATAGRIFVQSVGRHTRETDEHSAFELRRHRRADHCRKYCRKRDSHAVPQMD